MVQLVLMSKLGLTVLNENVFCYTHALLKSFKCNFVTGLYSLEDLCDLHLMALPQHGVCHPNFISIMQT